MRRLWHFLALGCILGALLLIALECIAPWETKGKPSPAQHAAAIEAGWIPGTDGYYRAIYGPDAY